MNDIRNKLIALVYEITKPEKPDLSDASQSLLAGALDSLDYASLLMAIEDEFGVIVADADTERLGSIDQLTAFVAEKYAA